MPASWFIGDLHFGHQSVAEKRGFVSTIDHDLAIIRKWKKQVKPEDRVYVMGDISKGGAQAEMTALSRLLFLPGIKFLISGNHDSTSGVHHKPAVSLIKYAKVFSKISDFGSVRIDGERILLSHFPYAASQDGPGRGEGRYMDFRPADTGLRLIHAHTHHTHPTNGSATGRELCVSWDAWGRLVDMGDIHQWMRNSNKE